LLTFGRRFVFLGIYEAEFRMATIERQDVMYETHGQIDNRTVRDYDGDEALELIRSSAT
jgi:hypothetical protein